MQGDKDSQISMCSTENLYQERGENRDTKWHKGLLYLMAHMPKAKILVRWNQEVTNVTCITSVLAATTKNILSTIHK